MFVEMNPQSLISHSFNGRRFYDALINDLADDTEITRTIYSADFQFLTGGKELAFFVQSHLGESQTFLSQEEYTNINNGIGLFSSLMHTVVPNLQLSNITKDTLAYHELTSHLGFLDHRGERRKASDERR